MTWRRDDTGFVVGQWLRRQQAVCAVGGNQAPYPQTPSRTISRNAGRHARMNGDFDIGTRPPKIAQNRRQDIRCQRTARAHDEPPALSGAYVADRLPRLSRQAHNRLGVAVQNLALRRQLDGAAQSVEQPGSQFRFEGGDLPGHGRLRYAQRFRRPRENSRTNTTASNASNWYNSINYRPDGFADAGTDDIGFRCVLHEVK